MSTLHLRASILNPGPEITPLKFRAWFRGEAADIDQKTRESEHPHQVSIIWLYLPEKLHLILGQAKLDKLFQGVVDKYETIYRVELRQTKNQLTMEEMMQARGELQAYMEALRPGPDGALPQDGANKPTLH
ncbi:MAG: hypothetical protein Q8M09_08095 [Pseudomonadota bacterium]|nr:hypothetical protein [Pseudomonadota bacterium]MDP1904189.1 hypothetical protein [Pseudomonadota bacterium]